MKSLIKLSCLILCLAVALSVQAQRTKTPNNRISQASSIVQYHDAALFNAPFGNVKCIDYQNGRICFNRNGTIDKANSTYLSLFSKYDITHDIDGWPVSVTTNVDHTKVVYYVDHRLKLKSVEGGAVSNTSYEYDDEKGCVTVSQMSSSGNQTKNVKKKYDVITYDYNGNWTSKGIKGNVYNEYYVLMSLDHYQSYDNWLEFTDSKEDFNLKLCRDNEDRIITYWDDASFEKTNSPKELSLQDILCPFFLGNKNLAYKDIEKQLKINEIAYSKYKDIYNYIVVAESNRLLYGKPIKKVSTSDKMLLSKKEPHNFWFYVVLSSKKESNDFIAFFVNQFRQEQGWLSMCWDINRGVIFKEEGPVYIHKRTICARLIEENIDGIPAFCVKFYIKL